MKNKALYFFYIIGLFFFLPLFFNTAVLKAQSYNFKFYSVDDGLAQSQVLCIFQDSKGYLWTGTNSGGVSRFNGKEFVTFSDKNGLVNNVVFSICEDSEGRLIFGTFGGVSVFDGKTFTNYTDKDSLPSNMVFKVLLHNNQIWLGTAKGPAILKNNKIEKVKIDDNLSQAAIFSMYADRKKNLWFATQNKGVFKYDGKKVASYSTSNGLRTNKCFAIAEDKKGAMYVGTAFGIEKMSSKGSVDSLIMPKNQRIGIKYLITDKTGNIWATSGTGIMVSSDEGKSFKEYTFRNGIPGKGSWAIMQDREHNIWFSVTDYGIGKFAGEKFINFSTEDSLKSNNVRAVCESSQGYVWVGIENGGAYKFVNYSIGEVFLADEKNPDKTIANSSIAEVIEDQNGNAWFGTLKGISKYDGKNFKNFEVKDGLKENTIRSLYQDKGGKLWIGTAKGVSVMENEKIIEFDPENKVSSTDVLSITEDQKGNYWFATNTGAVMYNNKDFVKFNDDSLFTNSKVRKILSDYEGNLWFATQKGLFRFKDNKFDKITEDNGLIANNIYSLVLSLKNELWIGTGKGIARLDLSSYNKLGKIVIKNFGKDEGFLGSECNSTACKDRNGRLWFGTIKGVTIFNPKLDKLNEVQPITNITKIKMNFEEFDFSPYSKSINPHTGLPEGLVLPYNKNHLTFDFIGISLSNPEKVKYKWILENFDDNWSPANAKVEYTYSNIPPGTYTFKVKSCNNDGVWNDEPTTFTFTITPPFWKTWWFISICVILTLVGVVTFINYRTAKLEKDKRDLENIVAERTAEISQQKEEIEAQRDEVNAKNTLIEHKNKDITDSINYAKRIQDAILPANELIKEGFPNSFVVYMPKDIVSGDFYWYNKRGGKYFIAACDCTGHGVPGAFMSMIGHNLLNKVIIDQGILEPGPILSALNNGLKEAFAQSHRQQQTNDGMDVALCVYDPVNHVLEYAGAQRPLYHIRNGELTEIKGTKSPIGGITPKDFEFINNRIKIEEGDSFFFFSDGYADQFGGPDGKKYMTKKLKEITLSFHKDPIAIQKEKLEKSYLDWLGTYEQVDDVLVIGLKY